LKVALGTAQFGLAYGVANQSERMGRSEAKAILDCAATAGIDTIDTAVAYGESETVLGELGVSGFRVISKLPSVPDGSIQDVRNWIRAQVNDSLARLRVSTLYGLLLHRPAQICGPMGDAIVRGLRDAQEAGTVANIGFSIYDPGELADLTHRLRPDLVQAPVNVLDRRLIDSGWAARLAGDGTEVHARSAFLQGLLLMDAHARPSKFHRWDEMWRRWEQWLQTSGVTALDACLGFVLAIPYISRVVVGVDSVAHLRAILQAAETKAVDLPQELRSDDPQLINPANWQTLP
jgi:aryl-alcohol dehydrogenase-like predicted oxidoreductase